MRSFRGELASLAMATMVAWVPASSVSRAVHSPTTVQPAHLYVALFGGVVERYPIVDGLARGPADLVYRTDASAIAIGPDGDLYVAVVPGGLHPFVNIYAPNSTNPLRRLYPAIGGAAITCVAVDRNGYIYVAFFDQSGSNQGIQVYAPGSSGHAKPLLTMANALALLTFDDHGDLYGASPYTIGVFADPDSDPRLIRTITTPYADGIAFNGRDEIYVDGNTGPSQWKIFVFPPKSSGSPQPVRTITVTGHPCTEGMSQVRNARVYVIDACSDSILSIDANANGSVTPLAVITIPSELSYPYQLAIGP